MRKIDQQNQKSSGLLPAELQINNPSHDDEECTGLSGQLLIAMPSMSDDRFAKTVIYMCAHSEEGAMGLIINRQTNSMDFSDLIDQIFTPTNSSPITLSEDCHDLPYIHMGGPVESGRGFVLHSSDYHSEQHTFNVNQNISLTATLDILKAIANGTGPTKSLLALGYAGWAPGQLESELSSNGWLHCPANQELIFETKASEKYDLAFKALGIDPGFLVNQTGHA